MMNAEKIEIPTTKSPHNATVMNALKLRIKTHLAKNCGYKQLGGSDNDAQKIKNKQHINAILNAEINYFGICII